MTNPDTPRAESLFDPSRRAELSFMIALAAAVVLLSFGRTKVFPFDPPSFFVTSARHYCQYTVTDPSGQTVALHEVGLGDFYLGQGGNIERLPAQEPGAVKLPDTINVYGTVPTREQVEHAVRKGLTARPEWDHVVVSQRVIAADGPASVGLVATHTWRIARASGSSKP